MDDYFRTSDVALAAFISMEEPVRFAEWDEYGSRESCFFYFADSGFLREMVSEFMGDEAQVNPRVYNIAYGNMKRLMWEAKKVA